MRKALVTGCSEIFAILNVLRDYVKIHDTAHVPWDMYHFGFVRPWWPAVIYAIVKSGLSFTNIYVKCAMLWVVDARPHWGTAGLHLLGHSVNCTPWPAGIAPPGKCCLLVSRTYCLFVPPLVLWRCCSQLFSFVWLSIVATQLMSKMCTVFFLQFSPLYCDIIICRQVIKHRKNCECCPVSLLIVR